MSQLSRSVRFAYRSKNLLRLNMSAFSSKERHEKLAITVHVLQNTYDFVISRCCFAEDGKEMDKDSKCTCRTIVLLIKLFVWRRSRCRRRRGLLKLPNYAELSHFTLLFCRGRQRNVQRLIMHVHSHCSAQ